MSGEGIGPAIFSGLLAAETIICARGDYSRRALSAYVERLTERLGRPYGRWLLSLVSHMPALAGVSFGKCATGSRLLRRELIAKRWFLRD
jgi:flavin-dependent dehydrogenase